MAKDMKKKNGLFSRIRRWYRRLFVEVPEGYGDTFSPEVEKFEEELYDEKAPKPHTPGPEESEGKGQ